MKIYYSLNTKNYINILFFSEEDKNNFLESSSYNKDIIFTEIVFTEQEKNLYDFIKKYSTFLKFEEDKFILDEVKYNNYNNKATNMSKIKELKNLLSSTDYKIVKCYEAQLGAEPMPYNLQQLLQERKAWREEINALEFEVSMLGN